jgi:hypothetical protein
VFTVVVSGGEELGELRWGGEEGERERGIGEVSREAGKTRLTLSWSLRPP